MAKIHCWANGSPGQVKPLGCTTRRGKFHVAHFYIESDVGSAGLTVSLKPADLRRLSAACLDAAARCEEKDLANTGDPR
ncbi:MAG: hypothetical protein BWX88_02670 [Planctomycetes bacterium ADurb.Bin126]|nr:MAG: hypothetical protein BWX88_02670 [Planctomycetes bacterium ADurb.Bin126]HOD79979.1 hypothetical protein [Phycisphaerae bacterium]HQL74036.1 hypothetical protein [Phycisphaerae bacterium]